MRSVLVICLAATLLSNVLSLNVSVEEGSNLPPSPPGRALGRDTRLFCDFYKGNCVEGCSSKFLFLTADEPF